MLDRLLSFLVAVSLALLVFLYTRSRDQDTLDNVTVPVKIVVATRQADNYSLEVQGEAQERQRVSDVRRTAAAPLVHRVDEEAEADAVHVLRQEVLGELPRERHQIVERDRTGDDDAHK